MPLPGICRVVTTAAAFHDHEQEQSHWYDHHKYEAGSNPSISCSSAAGTEYITKLPIPQRFEHIFLQASILADVVWKDCNHAEGLFALQVLQELRQYYGDKGNIPLCHYCFKPGPGLKRITMKFGDVTTPEP